MGSTVKEVIKTNNDGKVFISCYVTKELKTLIRADCISQGKPQKEILSNIIKEHYLNLITNKLINNYK